MSIKDIGKFGGKNTSLEAHIQNLSAKGIHIPNVFALSAKTYWYFIDHNHLRDPLFDILKK